jgi:hypothetical protein
LPIVFRRKLAQIAENCEHNIDLTIASYNANAVNFFNATASLARFENKNDFILL